MQRRVILQAVILFLALAVAIVFIDARSVHAQATDSSSSALSATIQSEIMADPRSQQMSQAQIDSMVDALTAQAEVQGVTAQEITYKPALAAGAAPALSSSCSGFSCALGHAFGLDGSIPLIPLALFVIAALFILIYGIMREMGHPHTRPPVKPAM